MVRRPTLIYCADGNRRFAEIAIRAGFRYGAQLPNTVYHPVFFADQDWRNPDRQAYMAALAEHRPRIATVLDWEREEQLPEVLDWAEEAAQYVEQIVVVPKVMGGIGRIPRRVGGKPVVLGYSVPTKYAGTELPVWEFAGWPVHLLGGSPHRQMELWHYFNAIAEVVGVDGNYHNLKATKYCEYWKDNSWLPVHPKQHDAPYEAFRRSCANIMAAWQALAAAPEEAEDG
jgi:hypothetical protein